LELLNSNKITYEKIILLLLMLCSITTFGQYAKIQEDIDLSIAFGQSFAPLFPIKNSMDWERISDLKLVGAYEPMGFLVEKNLSNRTCKINLRTI
jgi:hypothetical protein